jgi:hypothetical protein
VVVCAAHTASSRMTTSPETVTSTNTQASDVRVPDVRTSSPLTPFQALKNVDVTRARAEARKRSVGLLR